ncbi:MAG TPA: ferredoxin reductase [Acidimicrobiia bacterium]|nr:ferredoxin reductase [Acidimicrobiia bacterium]
MAGTALLGRLSWRLGEVVEITAETPRVSSVALAVPGWPGHLPGQHVDVRLTAEDGYQAQRSYSIANPALGERVVLTVEEIPDGEVSPFLVGELMVGDRFELRGPVGGYFVWEPPDGGPLQLVAGGSGVVPLMSMIRANAATPDPVPTKLLYSARAPEDLIYRPELEELAGDRLEVTYALTRSRPAGLAAYDRRVDRAILEEATSPPGDLPRIFVCGPTGFVETVADTLVAIGHQPDRVKTERFGPTGGSS